MRITVLCLVSSLSLVACRSTDNPGVDFATSQDLHVVPHDLAGDLNGKDMPEQPDLGDAGVAPDAGPTPDMYVPQFAAVATYPTSATPTSIAAGKLAPDTSLDLVVAENSPSSIDIFPGKGDGTFGNRTTILLPNSAQTVALGLIDGDTKLDAVVADTDGIDLLLGAGGSTFSTPANSHTTIGGGDSGILAAKLADMDGDGLIDVVAIDLVASVVWVVPGTGTSTFGTPLSFPISMSTTPNLPIALRLRQVDDDLAGLTDIVTANVSSSGAGAGTVSILLNQSTMHNFQFAAPQEITVGDNPLDVLFVDADGANHLDLIVANSADPITSDVAVYLSNTNVAGTVTFAAPTTYAGGDTPAALAFADFDNDGHSDLVSVDSEAGGHVNVSYGNGTGAFDVATTVRAGTESYAVGAGPAAVVAGPFSGGSTDLAVAAQSGKYVGVLINKR